MLKHYYPDNMEAPAMLLLWKLRDTSIIFFATIFMFAASLFIKSFIPLVPVAVFAIITITFPDGSIYDYIVKLGRYLITQQQIYFWK